VSPVTYAGEKEQALPEEMLTGTYDLASVGHMKMSGSTIKARNFDLPVVSSKVTLGTDMSMKNASGASIGTWTFDGDHTVTLKFTASGDESKDEYYKSGDTMTMFALYGYDKDEAEPVIALTGTDQNHITQFAKKSAANIYKSTPEAIGETTPIVLAKSTGGNPELGFDTNGTAYAGDPAALVDGDTVYMYVGHDTAENEAYKMPEWLCYSSQNMTDWTYEGVAMRATDISWRSNDTSAWASQCVKYGSKYYLYYCTWDKTASGKQSIGVAVSDSPTGPFTDPLGKPLVSGSFTTPESNSHDDIDPTVLIDTVDGVEHRYLAWGNTRYYVCELNENMTSVKDMDGDNEIVMHKDIKEKKIKSLNGNVYTEAPWLYKRADKYYLFFATNWREDMAYAMTDNPFTGRYDYIQTIMPPTATSNTNHPAVIDFNDKTYFIYHNGALPHGSGFRRSVCIDELKFDENGLIPAIVVDAENGKVLTLAYMNRESLQMSMEKGLTCFWSRSRRELWLKGETSGNYQHIVSITADCDRDALVVKVEKDGPACHKGSESCFNDLLWESDERHEFTHEGLMELIAGRKTEKKEGSYTIYL
ncbi:MAG: phosphoribosyl-AMP cyclohydrolase, partial [Clostridia bacterium]|nr:phosphoribosyl-AMP cyclohydrolase [Clostridia bacterium]